jgi:hypothetical protein
LNSRIIEQVFADLGPNESGTIVLLVPPVVPQLLDDTQPRSPTVDVSDERINARAVTLDLVFDPLDASFGGGFIGLGRGFNPWIDGVLVK